MKKVKKKKQPKTYSVDHLLWGVGYTLKNSKYFKKKEKRQKKQVITLLRNAPSFLGVVSPLFAVGAI